LYRKRFQLASIAVLLATIICISIIYQSKIDELCKFSRAALSYYGSSGQEVIDIQAKLYNWGYYNDIVDGIYGYNTYQSVRKFQAKHV
jgi:N-acetylmuramoyl-L-alanine amidase